MNRGYNNDSGLNYKNCGMNQYKGVIRRMYPINETEELFENDPNTNAVLDTMNDGLDNDDYKESDGPFDYKVEQPDIPMNPISEVGNDKVVKQVVDSRFSRDKVKPTVVKLKVERPTKRDTLVYN